MPGTGAAGGGGGAGERAPKPVLPFNSELPEWARGGTSTPESFSAESSWLDKRHDVEEKRAYLSQLEQDNTSTAAEIQDAKNSVIEADRDMYEQDMRLQETKRKSYEKTGDQLNSVTESLGSVAKLDEDLGISRGLVGMADNLLRFVAGLAAAPLKGLMAGMQAQFDQMSGKKDGAKSGPGGLNGLLSGFTAGGGPGGTFGSMFTGAGGYAGDAALLANVPSGQYTQGQRGDLTQGLADCSSAVEDLVNLMDGQPTAGASMYTGNAAEWLTSRGFMPGSQPGAFNVGWNAGHMQATLPGGTPFNWGSPASAAAGGQDGGLGAFDPAFTSNYYRPVNGQQQSQQQSQNPLTFPAYVPPGYAAGGGIPGRGNGDTIPVMAEPGEHMLTKNDVSALGGQSGVYSFRNALHRAGGGAIGSGFPLTPVDEELLNGADNTNPGLTGTPTSPGGPAVPAPFGQPAQIRPTEVGPAGTDLLGPQVPMPFGPDGQQVPSLGPDGQPLSPEQQQQADMMKRLAGFIPEAAKANTVAGTSNLSRIWMMGADVANGLIDQAASLASSAVAAGANAFAPGAGGLAGGAAAFGIGIGTEAAKRGISYGAQMGGIVSDALVEQLFPFGAPSFIGFDSAQNSINGLIDSKKKQSQGGVYDTGGVLQPGGVAVNMSKQPESVLTQQQWDLMSQTGQQQPGYGINIENVAVSDVNELSRSLNSRQRLAAMQYTGRPGM